MSNQTARGFAWLLTSTLGSKALSVLSQMALARLLVPEDWGLVALAATVSSFAGLVINPGLDLVLIQRHRRFTLYANAAFWMALASGVAGGVLILAAAPLGVWAYGRSELLGLIALGGAASAPVSALSTLPQAKLKIDMRFQTLATTEFVLTALGAFLSVAFAACGLKAYSFLWSALLVAMVRTAVVWRLAPVRIKRTLELQRWRYLVGDSASIVATKILSTGISQGDYVILGLLRFPTNAIGFYVFAFNLSLSVINLLTSNLSSVLMPVLSRLAQDPRRQAQAAIAAARTLAVLAIPLGLYQAAMADELVSLFFGSRWLPASRLLSVLSVGMAINAACWPAGTLLQAQGRFRTILLLTLWNVGLFLAATLSCTLWFGALGTAIGVTAYLVLGSFIGFYVATRRVGGRWTLVASIYTAPTACAFVAMGLGWLVGRQVNLASAHATSILRLAVAGLVGTAIYLGLMRVLSRRVLKEAVERVGAALPAQLRKSRLLATVLGPAPMEDVSQLRYDAGNPQSHRQ